MVLERYLGLKFEICGNERDFPSSRDYLKFIPRKLKLVIFQKTKTTLFPHDVQNALFCLLNRDVFFEISPFSQIDYVITSSKLPTILTISLFNTPASHSLKEGEG